MSAIEIDAVRGLLTSGYNVSEIVFMGYPLAGVTEVKDAL